MSQSASPIHQNRTPKIRPSVRAERRQRRHARRRKREFLAFFLLSLLAIIVVISTVLSFQHVSKVLVPSAPRIVLGEH